MKTLSFSPKTFSTSPTQSLEEKVTILSYSLQFNVDLLIFTVFSQPLKNVASHRIKHWLLEDKDKPKIIK